MHYHRCDNIEAVTMDLRDNRPDIKIKRAANER